MAEDSSCSNYFSGTHLLIAHFGMQVDPTCARASTWMGMILQKIGRYASAADCYQRALILHPPADIASVLQSTASVSDALLWLGEVDAAIEVLEGGMEQAASARQMMGTPVKSSFAAVDPTYVQSYLFALNMSTKPRDEVSNAHLEFGKVVRTRVGPLVPCAVQDKDPSRRLKVGYLSSDLCKHVVSDCLEGVLRARDREMQHVTCYQRNTKHDAQTEMLRSLSDDWVQCAELSPLQVRTCRL
jgi:protein O-GlcNAc transferase